MQSQRIASFDPNISMAANMPPQKTGRMEDIGAIVKTSRDRDWVGFQIIQIFGQLFGQLTRRLATFLHHAIEPD